MHLRNESNEGEHVEAPQECQDPLENASKPHMVGVHQSHKHEAHHHLEEDDDGAKCAAVAMVSSTHQSKERSTY